MIRPRNSYMGMVTLLCGAWLTGCVAQTAPDTQPNARTSSAPPAAEVPAPSFITDEKTIVLFDGSSDDQWQANFHRQDSQDDSAWPSQADGSVTVQGGNAVSRERFGDHQLHIEFFLPEMPDKEGQARANSGVYVHGRFELQVLDTFGREPFPGGCGGIYSIAPPLVNASKPAGRWQSYDIAFRAARFDEGGNVTQQPRITVLHNGVVIHNNLELPGVTPGGVGDQLVARGPLMLQDHGDAVRFRNIWVRRLD